MSHQYDPTAIEPRWQAYWAEHETFTAVEDPEKPPYYGLVMFPYPSGSGLHVGHPESYTALDIVARYKRMTGYSVLSPIGFDSFGLPAERAAQRDGTHPGVITDERIEYFRTQLHRLGFSYDWSREVVTSHADYYRWTQWIFLKLYEQGLAYLEEVPVWWCEAQGTVLSNEEVVDGRYVETGDPVERRNMRQWMLKITAYAQRLLDDLDTGGPDGGPLDWPDGVLEMQRQWIGRSEGAEVTFRLAEGDGSFVVYTTRPDTLFGATYCVLAPEHPLVAEVTTDDRRAEVEAYVEKAASKSELDRQLGAERDKTGVFTGGHAINPVNGEAIPVWVADYVLASYGTGAIMAVPAHDERDHAFARAFDLPIVPTYTTPEGIDVQEQAYAGEGTAINSGQFDGLSVAAFKTAIIDWLEAEGHGERKVNFKLRDWLFSRQRYWGEPFPILHIVDDEGNPTGEIVPVPPDDLPVELPHVDEYKPTATGEPPLARATDWLHTTAPDGRPAIRETNTMPQWAGSCWYYLRYVDPDNTEVPFSQERIDYWGAVDLYIGGVEHAVLHLLYARFWHKVLYDIGMVPTAEPFMRLANQGMILANSYRESGGRYHHPDTVEHRPEAAVTMTSAHSQTEVVTEYFTRDGVPVEQRSGKMGKSLNNSVDPIDIIERFGADTLRLYEMFMGPLEQTKVWNTSGCEGIHRFLSRTWRLFVDTDTGALRDLPDETPREVRRALHTAIKETTEGIETLKVNTPIAKMMELVNACGGQPPAREDAEAFLLILSPYAPHLAEELWSRLGHSQTLAYEPWPKWDADALVEDTTTIAVQVQGKLRGTVDVPTGASDDDVKAAAKAAVADHLEGKAIRKEIVVPGRLVNFVVG
ncbi:leucine--tRNA ligase [Euzebya sp.]|uniref:leucine--tRNA ligase n=1 Tax=Euzebya sp. TaxID=1971409 RepID=UPI0035199B1F